MQHYVPLILIFSALRLNAISGLFISIGIQFNSRSPCFCDLDIRYNLPRLQKVKLVWTGHEAKYDFYGKPRVAYAFYVVKSLMSPCLIFV